jgi:hypothetical protein
MVKTGKKLLPDLDLTTEERVTYMSILKPVFFSGLLSMPIATFMSWYFILIIPVGQLLIILYKFYPLKSAVQTQSVESPRCGVSRGYPWSG